MLFSLALSGGDSIQTGWPCGDGAPVTDFPVSEGTFLEAPCKAFWFTRACHQGGLYGRRSVFFYFSTSVTHFSITVFDWPGFDGRGWILAWKGSADWYNKPYFILKVYSVLILEVVQHKNNIRSVERIMKVCRWGGTLSLSSFHLSLDQRLFTRLYIVDTSKMTSNS